MAGCTATGIDRTHVIHAAFRSGVVFYALDVYGLGVCQGDPNPDCLAHSAMAPSAAMLRSVASMSRQQGVVGTPGPDGRKRQAATTSSGPPRAVPEPQCDDAHRLLKIVGCKRQICHPSGIAHTAG